MLVLSRKKHESILIGDEIEVVILDVAKNRVRIGFRCPADIPITRQELTHYVDVKIAADEEHDSADSLEFVMA